MQVFMCVYSETDSYCLFLLERNKYIEDKYMTQMRQFEQQTEEVQELRGDRVQLRQRLKQKTGMLLIALGILM